MTLWGLTCLTPLVPLHLPAPALLGEPETERTVNTANCGSSTSITKLGFLLLLHQHQFSNKSFLRILLFWKFKSCTDNCLTALSGKQTVDSRQPSTYWWLDTAAASETSHWSSSGWWRESCRSGWTHSVRSSDPPPPPPGPPGRPCQRERPPSPSSRGSRSRRPDCTFYICLSVDITTHSSRYLIPY